MWISPGGTQVWVLIRVCPPLPPAHQLPPALPTPVSIPAGVCLAHAPYLSVPWLPVGFAFHSVTTLVNCARSLKRKVSSTGSAGKAGQLHKADMMWLEHSLTPHAEINTKWIEDININLETIKLPEENIGKTLSDINCNNIILNQSPKAKKIKAKKNTKNNQNKWDLIKVKSFCVAKEITDKMKRPTEWDKIICKWCDQQGNNTQNT